MEQESQPIEHSAKEGHVEEFLDKEEASKGHRVRGSGSSADDYPYRDHGEEGGASHPKPKE
jgi:hypothetical protein